MSPDWKSKVGVNTAVQWPAGIGAKGNEGVANNVAKTKGSIGYVEYAYAKQNKLTHTKMINKDGKTVAPTSEAFQAAAANADWKSQPGYGVILANQPGDKSWPMTAATWILIYKKPQDVGATRRSAEVLRLGLRQGRQDGRRARLRADAGQRRRRHPEDVGGRDQGRERQAAVLRTDTERGKGAIRRLFLLVPGRCLAQHARPVESLESGFQRTSIRGRADGIRRETTRG